MRGRRSPRCRIRRRRTVRLCPFGSPRWLSPGLDAEEEPRVADRLIRRERFGNGPVEVEEHRVLIAREPLWADRAFRRALFGQPAEARHDETAPLEEIWDKSEREHPPQAEAPRLRDA